MNHYLLGLYEKAMPNDYDLTKKLMTTKACGFDYLELSIDETDEKLARLGYSHNKLIEINLQMQNTGVRIGSLCLSAHRKYPLGSHDIEIQLRSLEIMEKAIRVASFLNIPIIQLAGYDVYYEESDNDTKQWFGENLSKAVLMAAKEGILLGFETMETPFMDTVEKAMNWVNQINNPYLGLYPDMGNLANAAALYNSDILEDIEKGAGRIFAAHLKETTPGVYRNMDFGTGHTPYENCLKILLKLGVRRFTGEFWNKNESEPEKVIKAASKFLRNKIESIR